VECGNEDFRKKVLERNISNKRIEQVFQWLHDLQIRSYALIMIGFPDETKEMIKESMDFIRELVPFHTQIVVYYPYPGNSLYQYCKENRLLTRKTKTTIFRGESNILLKKINKLELQTLYDDFWRLSFESTTTRKTGGLILILKGSIVFTAEPQRTLSLFFYCFPLRGRKTITASLTATSHFYSNNCF